VNALYGALTRIGTQDRVGGANPHDAVTPAGACARVARRRRRVAACHERNPSASRPRPGSGIQSSERRSRGHLAVRCTALGYDSTVCAVDFADRAASSRRVPHGVLDCRLRSMYSRPRSARTRKTAAPGGRLQPCHISLHENEKTLRTEMPLVTSRAMRRGGRERGQTRRQVASNH